MVRRGTLLLLFLAIALTPTRLNTGRLSAARVIAAQTSTDGCRGESFGETRQQKRKCQGKGCSGANTGHDCGPEDIEITPRQITTKPGEMVCIRFDGTTLCN